MSGELDTLSLRVAEVVRQRDALARHLGYLLATITLPQNVRHVDPTLLAMANKIVDQLDADRLLAICFGRESKTVETEPTLPGAQPPAFDGSTGVTNPVIDFRQKGSEG